MQSWPPQGRHKALLDVAGAPMLARVIETLRSWSPNLPITISIDLPQVILDHPVLSVLVSNGGIAVEESAASPAQSVIRFVGRRQGACLVTTADHPLLTSAMLGEFWSGFERSRADLAAGVVREEVFRAVYADAPRTFIRLQDGAYSGANLFGLRMPRARSVVELWRALEHARKRPWRLARAFGPALLLRYLVGRLPSDEVLDRIAQRTGARVSLVALPWADAAVDVDRASDLALVEARLKNRCVTGDTAIGMCQPAG